MSKNASLKNNNRTALIIPRDIYKADLLELIKQGKEIVSRPINNDTDLSKRMSEYSDWFSLSLESLKSAFNKPFNEYRDDFHHAAELLGVVDVVNRNPVVNTFTYKRQQFIDKIESKLNVLNKYFQQADLLLSDIESPIWQVSNNDTKDKSSKIVEKICLRFHQVAESLKHRHSNRPSLIISDEYDVQDLLRSLLSIYFDDIRPEEYSPSSAGANSRMDFLLKDEKIVVETKMTNERLRDREIGEEVSIDIARYRGHPDCKLLIVFVYDKNGYVRNKAGLSKDLENMSSTQLEIKVYFNPL